MTDTMITIDRDRLKKSGVIAAMAVAAWAIIIGIGYLLHELWQWIAA